MDNEKTGKLIKTLRIEKGITPKELAEKIQVATQLFPNGKMLMDFRIFPCFF